MHKQQPYQPTSGGKHTQILAPRCGLLSIVFIISLTLWGCTPIGDAPITEPPQKTTNDIPVIPNAVETESAELLESEIIAHISETNISLADFQKRVRLEKMNLSMLLASLQETEELLDNQGHFQEEINGTERTLSDPWQLGNHTLTQLFREAVIKQEAQKMGLSISQDEVERALQEEIAASTRHITAPQATSTAIAASAITETTSSEKTFPFDPPAPILTDVQFDDGLKALISKLERDAQMSLDEYKLVVEARLLSDKVQAAIVDTRVSPIDERVRANHLLIRYGEDTPDQRTREQALELITELSTRISSGKAKFEDIAKAFSEDASTAETGGELGWFGKGIMVPTIEAAAFQLEIGEVSTPIETVFGLHLIYVADRDSGKLKDISQLNHEQFEVFEQWLNEQISSAPIRRPNNMPAMLPQDSLEALPMPVETVLNAQMGEQTFASQGNMHIDFGSVSPVPYNSIPPSSGSHYSILPAWQIHSEPLRYELLVHSLEDGGVVIYYQCGTECPELISQISSVATPYIEAGRHVLVAPNDPTWTINDSEPLHQEIGSRIALSAWRRVLLLDEFDAELIQRFIEEFEGIDHHSRN